MAKSLPIVITAEEVLYVDLNENQIFGIVLLLPEATATMCAVYEALHWSAVLM